MTIEDDIAADIAVAIDEPAWRQTLSSAEAICRRAILAALAGRVAGRAVEVSVLLTNDAHMRQLNHRYRQRDASTNVLSFGADGPQPGPSEPRVLGDIVLAHETVIAEAASQGKSAADHTAHLLIHGALHLLGLDHQSDADAEVMEALEVVALSDLGIGDPYATTELSRE